jgi:ParB family chromosome partitioning protein
MSGKMSKAPPTIKGVKALLGDDLESSNETEVSQIDLPDNQPRKYFDTVKMGQLIASIREKGILEPLLVRPKSKGRYELIAGERRLRAAREIGLTHVPTIVKELADTDAWEIALIENLQREDLNPVEEVEGILQLLSLKLQLSQVDILALFNRLLNEHKGLVNSNVTVNGLNESDANSNVTVRVKEILEAVGINNWLSFASNKLPLIKLPENVLEALRGGKIEYTKAKAIARVKDTQQRETLLQEAIAQDLSLTQIREKIAELNSRGTSAESNTLRQEMDIAYRQVKKSKAWDDPKKRKQLEKILSDLRAIVE